VMEKVDGRCEEPIRQAQQDKISLLQFNNLKGGKTCPMDTKNEEKWRNVRGGVTVGNL